MNIIFTRKCYLKILLCFIFGLYFLLYLIKLIFIIISITSASFVSTSSYPKAKYVYINDINQERLNKLFRILQKYESIPEYKQVFNGLSLINFDDLILLSNANITDETNNNNKKLVIDKDKIGLIESVLSNRRLINNTDSVYSYFKNDILQYLSIIDDKLVNANDLFVEHLQNLSDYYAVEYERNWLSSGGIEKVKILIFFNFLTLFI